MSPTPSARNGGLTADPLFIGATRPPMRWGVTYSALLANLVLTMEAFLLTRNLLTLLMCAPIHGVCALLWGRTRLPAHLATLRLWRASSYSPLTLDLPRGDGCRRSAPVVPIAPHGRRAAPC